MVHHMRVFIMDESVMSRGFIHYLVDLVSWDSLLVSLERLDKVLVGQLCELMLLLNLRQRVVVELRELKDLRQGPKLVSLP